MHARVLVDNVEEATILGAGDSLDAREAGELADGGGFQLAGAPVLGEGDALVGGDGAGATGVVL